MTLRPVWSTEQALRKSRLHSEPLSRNQNNQITEEKNTDSSVSMAFQFLNFIWVKEENPGKRLPCLRDFVSHNLFGSLITRLSSKVREAGVLMLKGHAVPQGSPDIGGLHLLLLLNTALHFLRSRDPSSYRNSTDFGLTFYYFTSRCQ